MRKENDPARQSRPMDQSAPPFEYQPLNDNAREIRLFTLFPGKDPHSVSGSLSHAQFEDLPPYEALSYVWGDTNHTRPIRVDQNLLHVTSNLENALRHLRNEVTPRKLWIDAICINQADHEERGIQVNMMREIYER